MRILTTGGCGYIGSHIVRALCVAGHQVVVYDNLSSGRREAIGDTELIVADINDADAMERVFRRWRFDMVIHLAALIDPSESMERPLDYYHVNVGGTQILLEHCLKHSVNYLIFSSTAAVYAPDNEMPIREDAKLEPINVYGRSKLMSERMINDCAAQTDLRCVIFRYYNVAGAAEDARLGSSPDSKHLIPNAVTAAINDGELTIYGTDYDTANGTCVRDYIHVLDLADAHCVAAAYLADGGEPGVFNCGSQRGFSVREVVDEVKRVAARDFRVHYGARREADPPCLIADATRIKQVMHWQARHDNLTDIISSDIKWRQSEVYRNLVAKF